MIVVLADDISGAAELAGLAAAAGWSAEVQTAFVAANEAEVVAVDTDTRSASASEAADRVARLAREVFGVRPEWIYKKTDSVLRGRVRAELTALLQVSNLPRALLVPANPSRGRVIREGRYYVGGVPLDETVFATDPEYPATTAAVAQLLARDGGAAIYVGKSPASARIGGIFVPDVGSTADLDDFAKQADGDTLCAGAAEFFKALLARRSGASRPSKTAPSLSRSGLTLFVCGSAAAWPVRRRECSGTASPLFELEVSAFEAAAGLREWRHAAAWVDRISKAIVTAGHGVIAIGSPPPSFAASPRLLLEALTSCVQLLMQRHPVQRLFLEGGATAAAVLRRLGWGRLTAVGQFAPDLAAFRPVAKESVLIGIKPGTYAWPKEIWPGGMT